MIHKITIAAAAALCLTFGACGGKTEKFNSADGKANATHNLANDTWRITDGDGNEPITAYDSMRVVEVGEDGHPASVIYYRGNERHLRQYYSNMQVRCEGTTVDGLREGRWVYYHPDGHLQAEATYAAGLEEGPYRVYRDNGAPYYIGQYADGVPTGTWEVYDPEGNLVQKTEY